MKVKLTVAVVILLMSYLKLHAQDIITDFKGNYLLGVPVTTISPQISPNNIGVNAPLRKFYRKLYYVLDDDSTKWYTMAKAKVLFAKVNIVNNSKPSLIFNGATNYSPSFELGLSWGLDSLINPSKKGWYWVFSTSAFGEYQNFRYYDTAAQNFSNEKTKQVSPGLKLNASFFNTTKAAVSMSISFQRSILTDKLTAYQKRTNTFYVDDNAATIGASDGYVKPVNATNNFRFSLATPLFFLSPTSNVRLPFALTPYYIGVFSNGYEANHNAGIAISFLSARFHNFDGGTDAAIPNTEWYKFASALSLGYNFISTNTADSRFVFVSGTFPLTTIFTNNTKAEKEQKGL